MSVRRRTLVFNQREDWRERSRESTVGRPEHVAAGWDASRHDLLELRRAERQQSKGTGSDVPGEFGNLTLSGDGGKAPSARAHEAPDHSTHLAERPPAARPGNGHHRRGVPTEADLLDAVDELVNPVHFPGEIIRRDVEPAVHVLRVHDTLEAIARRHLGAGASAEEVRLHVREIERLNHISSSSRISSGVTLILPGHTRDGGFVTRDEDGARRTEWSNGGYRIERSDGTGSVHTPGPSNTFTERHWGPLPRENWTGIRWADGSYEIGEWGAAPAPRKPHGVLHRRIK